MKYIITETQFKILVNQKKTNKISKQILEEIEKFKKNLNESTMINNAVVDVIRKYDKKGLLTASVKSKLLESNVSVDDLMNQL